MYNIHVTYAILLPKSRTVSNCEYGNVNSIFISITTYARDAFDHKSSQNNR